MKKAEIIKNGNVNLKTVKSGKEVNIEIDWDGIYGDYSTWCMGKFIKFGSLPSGLDTLKWLKKRLS